MFIQLPVGVKDREEIEQAAAKGNGQDGWILNCPLVTHSSGHSLMMP